jgi:hypothetical protein
MPQPKQPTPLHTPTSVRKTSKQLMQMPPGCMQSEDKCPPSAQQPSHTDNCGVCSITTELQSTGGLSRELPLGWGQEQHSSRPKNNP